MESVIMKAKSARILALRLSWCIPLALVLVTTSGCDVGNYKSKLVGTWINPLMEYHFREDGMAQHCFWTANGPRWVNGIWWVSDINGNRATVHFHRTRPAPKETSSFICEFEKDDLIQFNKRNGKYRMMRVDRPIDGTFKGPWPNAKYNPYWHTGRKT